MKKTIAIWLIVIFITSTFSFANVHAQRSSNIIPRDSPNVAPRTQPSTVPRGSFPTTDFSGVSPSVLDQFGNNLLGEAINIYADSFEPTVLTSNLVEQGSVPVYVFLKANTLGSLFGQDDATFEPLYGKPRIRYVQPVSITPNEFVQRTYWIPPTQLQNIQNFPDFPRPSFDVDNMGTLVVVLRPIPREADVPDVINLEVTLRSFFDTERTLSFGREQLLLEEVKDENEWIGRKGYNPPLFSATNYPFVFSQPFANVLNNLVVEDYLRLRSPAQAPSLSNPNVAGADDCFFAGQGCIRASEIGSSSATFSIYDGNLRIFGRDIKLNVGGESPQIPWQGLNSYLSGTQLKLKLDGIVDANTKKVKLSIGDGFTSETKWVKEGELLEEDSIWRVESINNRVENNKVEESVILRLRENSEIVNTFRRYAGIIGFSTVADLTEFLSGVGKRVELTKTYNMEGEEVDLTNVEEICDSETVSLEEPEKALLTNKRTYCNSINEFKKLISEGTGTIDSEGDLWTDRAYCRIGKAYADMADGLDDFTEQKFARALAIQNYERVQNEEVCFKENGELIGTSLTNLRESLFKNVRYGVNTGVVEELGGVNTGIKELDGTQKFIKILELRGGDARINSGVDVAVDGRVLRNQNIGSEIFVEGFIRELERDGIVVEYVGKDKLERITVPLEEEVTIEDATGEKKVRLDKVNIERQALVTVIPFSASTTSDSTFTVRIPVEKRPIKLTPDFIDGQIEKTEKIIEKLDTIIDRFETFVTSWRKFCIVTFGVLSIKNLFTGLAGSRTAVMQGVDGKSGWNQFCEQNSGPGKTYSTFDKCIFENEGLINKQIKDFDNRKDQFNDQLSRADGVVINTGTYERWKKEGSVPKHINQETLKKVLTQDEIEELLYLESAKESANECWGAPSSNKDCSNKVSFTSEEFSRYNELIEDLNGRTQSYDKTVKILKNSGFDLNSEAFDIIYKTQLQEDLNKVSTERFNEIKELYKLDGKDITEKKLSDVIIKEGSTYGYVVEENSVLKTANLERVKCSSLVKTGSEATDLGCEELSIGGRVAYTDGEGNIYLISREILTGQTRDNFASNAVAEYYTDGKPYCVPFKDGQYIKIEGYKKTGSVDEKEISLWNVGGNGIIDCGSTNSDDTLVHHSSELLNRLELSGILREMVNTVNKNLNNNEVYSDARGNRYKVVDNAANYIVSSQFRRCTDFMGILDCKILFNVCDPVTCPASRFNLGGRWQVDNVVRTGIIGSLVLGLPNWGADQPVPPVCMPGILAGLKNIRSLLQGYGSCLQEAKSSGTSVGICDRIRSVFICELVWKEALAILDVNQGLLSWIIGKGQNKLSGGGEYINFKSSLDNLGDSVNFFTQEYAKNSFAAYQSRSLGEFGAEICKAAVFSKVPGVGNFFDQLARPEDPPQFTATLSEFPHSETFGNSRYSVYYHLYAGNDPTYYGGLQGGLNFRIFLRDPQKGTVFYVTEGGNACGRPNRQFLEFETFADRNIDCIGRSGFNEVCIEINGITECGFGRVSSEFGLNYLEDFLVAKELQKEITNERECVSQPGIGASIGDVNVGTSVRGIYDGLVSPSSRGIARICSVNDPNVGGGGERNWEVVGGCGTDREGNNLGSCWADKRTFNVRDLQRREQVQGFFDEQGQQRLISDLGVSQVTLPQGETAENFGRKILDKGMNDFKTFTGQTLSSAAIRPNLLELIRYYSTALKDGSLILPEHRAEAHYMIGRIFLELVKKSIIELDISGRSLDKNLIEQLQNPGVAQGSSQEAGQQEEEKQQKIGEEQPKESSVGTQPSGLFATIKNPHRFVEDTTYVNTEKLSFDIRLERGGEDDVEIYIADNLQFNNPSILPLSFWERTYFLEGVEGSKSIYFKAVNKFGQGSEIEIKKIFLDKTPPSIVVKKDVDEDQWVNTGLGLTVSCTDLYSSQLNLLGSNTEIEGTGCDSDSLRVLINPSSPSLCSPTIANYDNAFSTQGKTIPLFGNDKIKVSPSNVCVVTKDLAGNVGGTGLIRIEHDRLDTQDPEITSLKMEVVEKTFLPDDYFIRFKTSDNKKVKLIEVYSVVDAGGGIKETEQLSGRFQAEDFGVFSSYNEYSSASGEWFVEVAGTIFTIGGIGSIVSSPDYVKIVATDYAGNSAEGRINYP